MSDGAVGDEAVGDEAEDTTIHAPVSLHMTADGEATLTFGPMPIEDLDALLENLSDSENFAEFRKRLDEGILAKLDEIRAEAAANG